ncbi:hypothetical protein FG386_001113 [Cryptosporidium ryanae]|uniref:uncharacterized protein n=1 Tax=Cryptosporidium ryanae TaxID=515981 RepID=UPI00351A6C62|nr:hypothetical protein FG386_001113 [Cryptosporidium ryanae]
MPKFKRERSKFSKIRNPLHIDIESSKNPYLKCKSKISLDYDLLEESVDEGQKYTQVPESVGKKILEEANRQLLQEFDEDTFSDSQLDKDLVEKNIEGKFDLPINEFGYIYVDKNYIEIGDNIGLDDSYWSNLLDKSVNGDNELCNNSNKSDVVDIIVSKLRENVSESAINHSDIKKSTQLPEKVQLVYSSIGKWLTKYKSGKLPKAFTIIPRLENWEEILYITEPHNWTPNAMSEAVRIFCSNLSPNDSLKFYSEILYPIVRENISQNYGKLNYHYYQALKKALFKHSAWFKGILLPLAADESCTVKEAVIIGSILSKVSIPVLHAAAAIIKLSKINPWNTCQTHFIMILLSKKYSMPRKVISELVESFYKFNKGTNSQTDDKVILFSHNNVNLNSKSILTNTLLPVTWHKTLLTFVQRYKYEFSSDQILKLQEVVKNQYHYLVSPEIIRELSHSLIQIPNES